MQDWIAQRRKDLTAQRDQFAANANMCVGALEMLTAVEAELAKPPVDPPPVEPPAEPPAD